MIILLRAEFARLLKSKELYASIVFLMLLTLLRLYLVLSDPGNHFEDGFFFYVFFLGILNTVFISMFVGSEYHYGTLRNKLIIGHTRWSIYLTELLVCIIAGWIICLAPVIISLALGLPLLGFPETSLSQMLLMILGTILLSTVYSSLFVLLALLCRERTITSIAGLLLAVALLVIGFQIYNALLEPETYQLVTASPEGQVETGETMPNPHYLTGAKRSFYLFLTEFLPGGQSLYLSGFLGDSNPLSEPMVLYDIVLILISSGCGMVLFRKKDL